ncbi:hypothetical protein, partial [Anaplasma phagocytophilum]|uniref:hypothetical protein n=1 Tax=Anaplasma phagocytophilum TaxID=948 RepID=UPI000AB7E482
FPEDYDVADAEQRLAMPPIRGFVPLPTILSESEDESSSLGSRYSSDSDDEDFFSSRSTLTSPSPSLEDIAALAVEAQNMRDLSDRVVTPAPEDLAAGDGTGDRGIAAPIDGVPGQDGGAESRTSQEPAAALAPEDLAAGDGVGARGISAPIDEVPAQDGGVGDITPERPIPATRGRDLGPRGGDGGGARRTTPREPDAPDSGDDDYPAASAGRGQVITVEAEVYDEEGRPIPAARGRDLGPHGDDGGASGRTTPIDGEGAVEPTPTITFPEDYDVADAEQRLAMPPIRGFVPLPTILSESEDESSSLGSQYNSDSEPYTSIPGSDGTALSSHAPSSRTSSISSTTDAGDDDYPSASAGRGQVITAEAEVYDKEGRPIPAVRGRDLGKRGDDGGASDRGIAAPIDGVPGQDGGTEGKTPQEPATTAPAPIDIAAGDGSAREIASTIDRSGPDVGVAP